MDIELTVKNYRCFSDVKPARIIIKQGYTAFIGINNSGKSSILKLFYEFRELFQRLSGSEIVTALNGNVRAFNFPQEIMDQEEVFCNLNNRNLTIEIQLIPTDGTEKVAPPVLSKLAVIVPRGSNTWTCKIYLGDREVSEGTLNLKDDHLYHETGMVADLSHMLKACGLLGNMVYIPSFRNAINAGAGNYYDIPIGQAFITQWNGWKTGPTKKLQESAYRVQRDIAKIFEYSQLEINASPDGQRLHMLINGKSYKVSELGSGLSHLL